MRSDEEIKATPGLQAIGNLFGIGESGYFWRLGKRVASVIWTRKDGHVSVSWIGRHIWTADEIEKFRAIFFKESEFDSLDIEQVPETGTVHFWQKVEADA